MDKNSPYRKWFVLVIAFLFLGTNVLSFTGSSGKQKELMNTATSFEIPTNSESQPANQENLLDPEPWWDSNWSYCKKIIIDHNRVASDLFNFPVLILNTSTDFTAHAQSNGNDFVFVDATNTTQYAHEIESYDSASGKLIAWVNIPSLSSTDDTVLYLYYGNPSCSSQQSTQQVWDQNYVMVQHLKEISGIHQDSTSYNNDGTPNGGVTQHADGIINSADSFDGVDDYIDCGNDESLHVSNYTLTAWIYPEELGSEYRIISNGGFSNYQGAVDFVIDSNNKLTILNQDGSGQDVYRSDSTTLFALNQWAHVAVTYSTNDNLPHLYVNGIEVSGTFDDSVSTMRIPNQNPSWNMHIGTTGYPTTRFFNGLIDEIGISKIARSSGWINTLYQNQNDPVSFITFGAEKSQLPNQPPQANFIYTPENPTTSDVITFTDTSTDADGTITSWNWDFCDGNTSILQNPTHQYFTVGTYNVTLTVTDNDNAFDSIVKTIIVTEAGSPENWTEMQKLLASDGATSDLFGCSVSLDGNTALIGAYQDDDNGEGSGSAYVFTRTGTNWTLQQKLLTSDGESHDYFGVSVSLVGDTALIGAMGENLTGSAYVFIRTGTTWTQQAKLLASDGATWDYFGYSVSLSGDTALIGAELDGDNGANSGSAYVFARTGTTWTQQAKLLASDGETNDGFGISVSLSGDTALIGAYLDHDNGAWAGSAYVFTRNGTTWTQQAELLASDGTFNDRFGFSVSLAGDTALIGAYFDDDNGVDSGSAYVFTRTGTTWTQHQKLLATDGATRDSFGYSVSLDGDTALIGAYYDYDNGEGSGSAYVFTRTGTTWTQQAKLLASDGAIGDCFGYSVSLDGDTALIGAVYDDNNEDVSGSAYVFIKETENQLPIANFIYTPENPTTVDLITFTDSSYDTDGIITNWSWDFGDSNVSYAQNPIHQYMNPGTCSVILTVTDDDFATDIITKEINIILSIHKPVHNLNTSKDFSTIQAAIDDSETRDGHTIYVESGIYHEHVCISKSLKLIGEDRTTTIIDGQKTPYKPVIIAGGNVLISDFTISNSTDESYAYPGILLGSFVNVQDCNIKDCDTGIYSDRGENSSIVNCSIFDNWNHGILLMGLGSDSINNYLISKCKFFNNGEAIRTAHMFNSLIDNCSVMNNVREIFDICRSSYNKITNCNVSNNRNYCMFYGGSSCNVISDCIFSKNTAGLWLFQDSNNNTICNNTFRDNNQGVTINAGANNNLIYNNNFINNIENAYDECNNTWDDGYPSGGNYWSDYKGNDSYSGPNQNIPGSDGIGDTSYNIPGGSNQDLYPFMLPNGNLLPIANFTYSPQNPTNTSIIHFIDTSTDSDGTIVSWWWNFGDHYYSDLQSPIHCYYENGIYNVTLTVTDNDGAVSSITKMIVVGESNQPPIANFIYSPENPTTNDVISFTDTSTDADGTITAWNWNFGDENTSILQNPTHQYFTVGIFNVTLTVTDNDNASDFIVKTIIVTENGPGVNWSQMEKLLASDGATMDYFGYSVSLNGDTALIGTVCDDGSKGSAYVFTRTGTTWTFQQKLLASDGTAGDYFGISVSLSGETALIGAVGDDDNGADSGSAYVFTRNGNTWTQQAKLLASDGAAGDYFGCYVSVYGNTALIGAHYDDEGNVGDSGSAYVFTRTGTTWTQQQKLNASDGAANDWFGWSVSLNADTALIGTPADESFTGSAYVFTRTGTTWTQQAKLLASDGAALDQFGLSVSLVGDTALIGATSDDDNGGNSGSAYVFTRTGTNWTQQAKLLASDGAANDLFGYFVSLSGDTALIGAIWDDDNGADSGSAYIFTRTGTNWTQQTKFLASDGAAGDNFGWSVSLDRDTALIGAPFNDDNGQDSGSAYVFTKGSENQPPNANFTFTPENPTTIDTIQFTDISIDADGTIVSWSWDFGDGIGTSNEQNPTYQYLNPGTYSLILTVTDDNLATDTITKEINITPPIHKPVHNLNSGEDFYTIQSAIDDPDTVEGHTIFVESGIYNENVNIWKSITLFGEDRDNTIIDGGGRGNVVNITANRVNISGFTVRNENLVYGWSGIFLDYVSLCRIEDNTVQDNTNNGKGINLKCSNNNNIIANNISNNQIGIIVESCSNNIISCNNVLYNIDYGIDLGFGDTCNNIVTGNTVFNNAYTGIFLAGSDNNIIGNTISKNRFGICVSGGFNTVRGNTIFSNIVIGIFNMGGYNTIIDNVLSNNTCGIQIEYSLTNNHILANNISNSQYGIYLEFSTSNNDITGNTISKNNIGIVLSENSHANTINNNIFNNTNNAYDYGNNIWNISKISGANIIGGQYLGGNYWSDYTGEDLDSDGLGDTNVPYGPGDYLPLVSPIQNQPPYTPSNPSPTNGATEVNINSHLSWIGGDPNQDDTDTYDVFFGTSNPPPKSVSNQTGTTYDPGTMQNVTIYYWRIVSWDNHGASTSGPVWNFTTQRPGYIKAWGDNGSGQCDVPEPNTDFIAIAAGNDHSLGLKANGSIIAWGENSYGQCNAPNPNTDFISVAAGVCYSLGLKADGSIIAWGWNNSGQCNVPEPNTDFIAIAAKGHHSLGLKTDGSIVAWGYNGSGQCDVPEPNTDFIAIAAGYLHSLGLKANGSIVAWGDNYWGQSNLPEPNTDFIAIAAGIYHNLGLKTDSSIVAWGNNLAGACNVPEPNTNFIAVAAGIYHSLGLKANGSIVAWGTNNGGQCNVPEPNTDFIAIAAGWSHSLGIKVNSPPYTPSNPNPSDTAIHVPLNTPLGWNGGDPDQGDTVTYDVYFGTTNPPPLQIQNQTETTFNPGTLNYSSMYYWQIVVWDNHGTSTPGPTWSFTTELQPGFFMNLNNFPMYPAIATPGYHEMCGPAVAQMTLNYLWWNSSNDSTPPMTFDNQTWLYQRGKENNTNTTLPYLDTQGIWNIIQYNEPMPYATYGYNFAPDASTDQSYMLKEICTWINYTIGTYGGHKPGHPTNVPAIVPAYGDYSNWMTIRGFHSDQPAYPPQSNLTIYGFWVNDPYPSSLGGMGENSYKTVGDWLGTYYKPLQTDDQYNGKYVAICEPPITKDNTKVTLGSSPARFTKDQLSLINDVKTRFITNKPIEESIQKQVNQWVIDAATQGLTEQLLPYDNEFASAFVKTTPGQPLLVQNLNNGDDYYLVPFNIPLKKQIIEPVSMPVDLRHEVIEEPIDVPLTVDEIDNAKPIDDAKPVATPLPIDDTQNVEPILKTGTTVVVIIDANDGSFKEASWTKKPVTYLPISQDNARQLVIKYCKEKGIDLKDPTTMTIDLVYRHSSPYYPEWRITIEEPKLEFYISQDGNYTL